MIDSLPGLSPRPSAQGPGPAPARPDSSLEDRIDPTAAGLLQRSFKEVPSEGPRAPQRISSLWTKFKSLLARSIVAVLPDAVRSTGVPKVKAGSFSGRLDTLPDLIEQARAGKDLSEANLEGLKFTDRLHARIALAANANFKGANLEGLNLQGLDLSKRDMTGAVLTKANLGGCNLEGTRLADATLKAANLQGAHLDADSRFDGADVTDADLRELQGYRGHHFSGAMGFDFAQLHLPEAEIEPDMYRYYS